MRTLILGREGAKTALFPSGLQKNFFSMFLSLISIAAPVFVVIQGKSLIRKLAYDQRYCSLRSYSPSTVIPAVQKSLSTPSRCKILPKNSEPHNSCHSFCKLIRQKSLEMNFLMRTAQEEDT